MLPHCNNRYSPRVLSRQAPNWVFRYTAPVSVQKKIEKNQLRATMQTSFRSSNILYSTLEMYLSGYKK